MPWAVSKVIAKLLGSLRHKLLLRQNQLPDFMKRRFPFLGWVLYTITHGIFLELYHQVEGNVLFCNISYDSLLQKSPAFLHRLNQVLGSGNQLIFYRLLVSAESVWRYTPIR